MSPFCAWKSAILSWRAILLSFWSSVPTNPTTALEAAITNHASMDSIPTTRTFWRQSSDPMTTLYGFTNLNGTLSLSPLRITPGSLIITFRMLGDCALFEFSMSVRFEQEDSKTFACTGPELPPSLNGVNYINPQSGYLHMAENYLVDFMQYTFFEVKSETYFKIAASPADNSIDLTNFAVSLFSEENTTYWVIESNTIYRLLNPGNYSLFVSVLSFDVEVRCPEGTPFISP